MQRAEHPGYLICPVTFSIFNEPVTVMPSGITYEWEMIKEVITRARAEGKKPLCPKSREPINGYIKAFQIDEAVCKYLQDYPDAKSDQYVKQHPHKHPPAKYVQLRRVKAPVEQPPRQPETEISPDDMLAIQAAQAELNTLPSERDVAGQIERIHQQDMERLHEGLYEQFRLFNQHRAQEKKIDNSRRFVDLTDKDKHRRSKLLTKIDKMHYELGQHLKHASEIFSGGPVNTDAMPGILNAAAAALCALNPDILARARNQHHGRFDLVEFDGRWGTLGEIKDNKLYGIPIEKITDKIKHQPGYAIHHILKKVDKMLEYLCGKYPEKVQYSGNLRIKK